MASINIKSIFKIIQLPEILFIILTQYLFRYCILIPFYGSAEPQINNWQFFFFVLASVLIAISGYFIKYHFDNRHYDKDYINSFYKNVNLDIKTAYNLFFIFAITGSVLGILIGYGIGMFKLGLVFMLAATMLYYYALRYQGLLFWGNASIAFLTSLSLIVVWLFEFFAAYSNPDAFSSIILIIKTINTYFIIYTSFIFIITFIQKIIADIKKKEYDKYCFFKSFPISLGDKGAKTLSIVLAILLFIAIAVLQMIMFAKGMKYFAIITFILVQIPLIYIIIKITKSKNEDDYTLIVNLLKWVTLFGMLTLVGVTDNIFTSWIF